ncbi:Saposin-like type B, region 1 [Ancylostoma duodenale]|uniref:Saposin-like type B, region 1 n=1 Tax=Ancylostoma duodenale TaxID=51022 RepID=A0A0C2G4U5_9BILA|nr:Saposin-like type B, region 1 [Ancylostoma duodenale]
MRLFLLFALIVSVALATVVPKPERPLVSKHKVIRQIKKFANEPHNRAAACDVCTIVVDGINLMIQQNKTDTEIANFLIALCDDINLEQPHVCKHIVQAFTVGLETEDQPFLSPFILLFQYELVFVFEKALFTPNEFCGAFIHDCGVSEFPLHVMWNITIPDNKPPVKPWPKIPDNKPTYKVLHLSDIHIDRQYAIGSEAYCQLDDALGTYAMCCRNYAADVSVSRTKTKPIYVPSGPWGMPYACDLPYRTFEAAMKHIGAAHTDLDYIIITGDFEAHDSWDYTEDLTRANIDNVTNVLLKYFPKIPVYISIGNHEGVPQDAMAPHTMPEYDQRGPQWLYSIMKKMWSNWLPSSALADVQ